MKPTTNKRIRLGIRIFLGIVFLLSGIGKLIEPGSARYLVELMATEYYWLIEYTSAIVTATSVLEIALAIPLLLGRWIQTAYILSGLMIAFFTLVLGYFWIQGQSIENCGCFGALGIGGGLEASLIRNGVLLMLIGSSFVLEKHKSKRVAAEKEASKNLSHSH